MILRMGGLLLGVIVLIACVGPLFFKSPALEMNLSHTLQAPSWQHPMGTDQNGIDVTQQIVLGARVSLLIALCVVSIGAAIGLLLGSLAGWRGQIYDVLIMRILDIVQAFPGFLLSLALVAVMGPSLKNLIFALSLTSWCAFARLVRGEVLHLKERDYVMSARAAGAPPWHILVFHIWPNLWTLLIVQMSFGLAGAVITESGLSFLGLGVPPDTPTWGSLLNSGRRFLTEAFHLSFFPGLALLILVLSFNLIANGLRDRLSPRDLFQ